MSSRLTEVARRVAAVSKRFLEHRHLPVMLAVGAVVVMLPALKTGLMMDDLIQRLVELQPAELPPRIQETGLVSNPGRFTTVLCDLFGYGHDPESLARAKNYGAFPWSLRDDVKAALWRPFTAFTHWLDYRLYPNTPALMHAQNLAWFAAIVGLLTVVYRRLMGTGWSAGLAALLFLLDGNTYFPVMFVANRGFIVSLFFGLLCLHQHHQWRASGSRPALFRSLLWLALALFANEGGASAFAFVLAYALVLQPGSWGRRAMTVLPSVLVICVWRSVYQALGFGVANVGGYIDPANEPRLFAQEVIPRVLALLGGQFTGVAPEFSIALHPAWQRALLAVYCGALAIVLVAIAPLARRDRIAAYWLAVTVLAAIAAATVVPMSKNLGFVTVGACGLMACFVAGLVHRAEWVPRAGVGRTLAWLVCGLLIVVHVPGAVIGRIAAVKVSPTVLSSGNRLAGLGDIPNAENREVVLVNPPTILAVALVVPYRAYHNQTLPGTLRTLAPACGGFEISRPDARTLVVQSRGTDLFSCADLGPIHSAYACSYMDTMASRKLKAGDRMALRGLEVEVLEISQQGWPSRVRFHFETSLDSPGFHWLRFDWATSSYQPFEVPAIGQTVSVSGPRRVTLATVVRRILGSQVSPK